MNGGNATPKRVCPEAKGGNPTTDIPCSGLVTHSGEILTNDKSHKKKIKKVTPKDDTKMRRVLQMKYATRNIRKLGEKEKEI